MAKIFAAKYEWHNRKKLKHDVEREQQKRTTFIIIAAKLKVFHTKKQFYVWGKDLNIFSIFCINHLTMQFDRSGSLNLSASYLNRAWFWLTSAEFPKKNLMKFRNLKSNFEDFEAVYLWTFTLSFDVKIVESRGRS